MSQTLWSFHADEARRQMERAFEGIETPDDWQRERPILHRQFMTSMGLDPLPPRCDLSVREYGSFAGPGYRAIRLAWQLLPDCWATGNLYLPEAPSANQLPALLYTCGHRDIGVHGYQDHAMTWARRGYACLIVDTLEQHDNPGDHHGLYFNQRPDWISLGYTAAGGELWNSIRAVDLLASRSEVDPHRLGVTGISGGGGASFWLGIADDRIAAVASVAGVSSFHWAMKDRFLQGHCDCMYPHNPFGRDIAEFAALTAPRPLLLAFARHDPLYSPDEFRALAGRTQRIYNLLGQDDACALFEYDGPHAYQSETIETIQRWFDKRLDVKDTPILTANTIEQPEPITTIFNGLPPAPDHVRLLPELLSPVGGLPLPRSADDWQATRKDALADLKQNVLMRVHDNTPVEVHAAGDWQWEEGGISRMWRFNLSGMEVLATLTSSGPDYDRVLISLAGPHEEMRLSRDRLLPMLDDKTALLIIEPRGAGFTSVHPGMTHHLLRAGALIGLTPTMLLMQDLWRVMPHLSQTDVLQGRKLYLHGRGDAAVACLYHALFDQRIAGVLMESPPPTHRDGAHILGILRHLDLPQVAALLTPRPLGIVWEARTNTRPWHWLKRLHERLNTPAAWTTGQSLTQVAGRIFDF